MGNTIQPCTDCLSKERNAGPRKSKKSKNSIKKEIDYDSPIDDKKLKIESQMHDDGIQTVNSSQSDVHFSTNIIKQ